MPYKKVSTETADVMIKGYKVLKDEITALEKKKGDKNEIKRLQKELEEKGKRIEKKLMEDITAISGNGKKHFQNVDQWLGQAERTLGEAKKAIKDFEKTHDGSLKLVVDGGPATIAEIVKLAKADSSDFGQSWFDYRTFNPKGLGLDEKFAKPFGKARMDLQAEQKGYTAKIDKLPKLVEEAVSLVKLMGKLAGSVLESLEDSQDEAKKLAKRLAEAVTAAEEEQHKLNAHAKYLGETAERPGKDPKADLVNAQGAMKNILSLDKDVRNELLSLAKILETTQKSLKDVANDPQVKKLLGEAVKSLGELKKVSDEMRKTIQTATKAFQTIAARAK